MVALNEFPRSGHVEGDATNRETRVYSPHNRP